MAYRRTKNVVRRLAARQAAIIAAAGAAASEGGMAAVQSSTSRSVRIAAGRYRYFPGKADLVEALLAEIATREICAVRKAAAAAPGRSRRSRPRSPLLQRGRARTPSDFCGDCGRRCRT